MCLSPGVGANTAMLSVLDAVVLRQLPLKNCKRVFVVRELREGPATGDRRESAVQRVAGVLLSWT